MTYPTLHNAYKPDSFVVCVRSKEHISADSAPRVSLPFRIPFETGDHAGSIAYLSRDMLTSSADGRRFILLAGRIYRPESAEIGLTLLRLYEQRGAAFVRDLNGSFTLVVVDQDAGEIVLATDRLNTIKLLVSEYDGTLVISNAMDAHPLRKVKLDPAAIVSYLVSGHIYSERTVLDGVRVLDGGSIYLPRGQRLEQQRYWRYLPSDDETTPITPALRHDLEDALVDAVRVRLRTDRPNYVSLSVGYDSRALLGILAERLKTEAIRTFSYTYGEPRPMTNEALAPQIAALYGYEHQLHQSFHGQLVETLVRNGQLGAGMADVCDELDLWHSFSAETGPRPVLFTGDTIMPPFNFRLRSAEDALQGAKMADLNAARWLEPMIGQERYASWLVLTRAELDSALQRVDAESYRSNVYQLYDRLRVENPDNRRIFSWREYYTGRFFEVVNPLLDEVVTDIFMNAPIRARRGRRVFIEVVTAMFPQLFALPRVTATHYADYWSAAFSTQADDVRAWIRSASSPLDDLIEPELLLALLAAERTSAGRPGALLKSAEEKVYHFMRRLHWQPGTLQRPYLVKPVTSPQQLLKRALVLRSFLQFAQARQGKVQYV